MKKWLALTLLVIGHARAADVILGNLGGTVTNTVTNTVTVAPAWLTNSQSLAVGDASTNLTINASNGVFTTLFLTNALTSNVVATLHFTGMGAPLTPLWLTAVSQSSLVETQVTNTIWESLTVADAGDSNANQTYYYNPTDPWDNGSSGYPGSYTNDVNTYRVSQHVAFGGAFFIGNNSTPSRLYAGNADLTPTNTWTVDQGTEPAPTVTGIEGQLVVTNFVTNTYAMAWSTSCLAENGAVRPLAAGTNSYFIVQQGATNIVTGCATNLQAVANP